MANSVGLIDSTYRGELKVVVWNLSDDMYTVSPGTSLFQIVSPDLKSDISFEFVSELDATERGDGGFGSTGK